MYVFAFVHMSIDSIVHIEINIAICGDTIILFDLITDTSVWLNFQLKLPMVLYKFEKKNFNEIENGELTRF